MKQLAVISGKGGTGKTTVVGGLCALASDAVFVDADVDAANLGLILGTHPGQRHPFYGLKKASIDRKRCVECLSCADACRQNAIFDFEVDTKICAGCRVCYHVCPEKAVDLIDVIQGHWEVSDTRYGYLVHARLCPGASNSGQLVSKVRSQGQQLVDSNAGSLIIIDGPAGSGCPVISAITGVDLVLIVTEPSLSGIRDLKKVVSLCEHFRLQMVACINKYDLNRDLMVDIEEACKNRGIDVVGRIPLDRSVMEAMTAGRVVVSYPDSDAGCAINEMWRGLEHRLR